VAMVRASTWRKAEIAEYRQNSPVVKVLLINSGKLIKSRKIYIVRRHVYVLYDCSIANFVCVFLSKVLNIMFDSLLGLFVTLLL